MANGNGNGQAPQDARAAEMTLQIVIKMDPRTRAVALEGNILVDRPTCMMMLEEAKLGIIDYHKQLGNKDIQVERTSLILPDRKLGL